ncbi:MAG: hypothetical protein U9Q35_04370 [Pseudomonadota bacterium]|nr:hypothetical protein [Pseudomonadota bacterium]
MAEPGAASAMRVLAGTVAWLERWLAVEFSAYHDKVMISNNQQDVSTIAVSSVVSGYVIQEPDIRASGIGQSQRRCSVPRRVAKDTSPHQPAAPVDGDVLAPLGIKEESP